MLQYISEGYRPPAHRSVGLCSCVSKPISLHRFHLVSSMSHSATLFPDFAIFFTFSSHSARHHAGAAIKMAPVKLPRRSRYVIDPTSPPPYIFQSFYFLIQLSKGSIRIKGHEAWTHPRDLRVRGQGQRAKSIPDNTHTVRL